jgi:hypothetical protein
MPELVDVTLTVTLWYVDWKPVAHKLKAGKSSELPVSVIVTVADAGDVGTVPGPGPLRLTIGAEPPAEPLLWPDELEQAATSAADASAALTASQERFPASRERFGNATRGLSF